MRQGSVSGACPGCAGGGGAGAVAVAGRGRRVRGLQVPGPALQASRRGSGGGQV